GAVGRGGIVSQGWVPLAQAAGHMGMSRFGARKRLQRLQATTGETILRQVGVRWEVSTEALRRALSEPERRVDDLARTVAVHDERIEALRRVGVRFRKETKA